MDQDFSANVSSAGYGDYVPETQPSTPGQGNAPPAYAPPANTANCNAPYENAQSHQRPHSDQPSRRHNPVENHDFGGRRPDEHYGNPDANSRPHRKGENSSYFYPEGEDDTNDHSRSQNSSRQHPQSRDHYSEQRKHQQHQQQHYHNEHEHRPKGHHGERMHEAYDHRHGHHKNN